eukprot:scaffold132595_cov45-Prasinocladus_malaysianus.AAC.1
MGVQNRKTSVDITVLRSEAGRNTNGVASCTTSYSAGTFQRCGSCNRFFFLKKSLSYFVHAFGCDATFWADICMRVYCTLSTWQVGTLAYVHFGAYGGGGRCRRIRVDLQEAKVQHNGEGEDY